MDCRKTLLVGVGLLLGVGGCTYPFAGLRSNTTEAQKPPEEVKHKPSTYVAFGDFRASAGFSPEQTPALQQQYREEAKLAYLKALEVDPTYIPAYLALARLQQACDDHAGAQGTYEQALKINDHDPRLWFELGVCQCRAKNWNTAVDALTKACELDPANRECSTTLGFVLARAGRYDESFAALSRHNGEAKAHYDLARMLKYMNEPDLARSRTLLALQKDPSLKDAQTFLAELDGKPAKPAESIQTAEYLQPPSPTPPEPTQGNPPNSRRISMPPLPLVSLPPHE